MRDFSSDHRWLSLNTATIRKRGDLVEIIDACARHGIRAIDPWRDQVAAVGLDRAARAVREAGLDLSGYCRGGMFTSDASRRGEVRDDNRRCVDEAKALGAPCIVLVVGGLPQYSRPGSEASKDIAGARTQVEEALADMLDYAKQAKLPLAIEPLHPAYAADRACVNTAKQALDICDRLDRDRSGMLGVALDVYHIWWGSGADGADRARRAGSPARLPCMRLAGADQGHSQRPRHDGRWRDRYQIRACSGRGAGLCRLFGDRNLLQRLVEQTDG
ncbi:sugar phosphate isomerase/epimerase [Bradyrhizobium sp. F1.13.4]